MRADDTAASVTTAQGTATAAITHVGGDVATDPVGAGRARPLVGPDVPILAEHALLILPAVVAACRAGSAGSQSRAGGQTHGASSCAGHARSPALARRARPPRRADLPAASTIPRCCCWRWTCRRRSSLEGSSAGSCRPPGSACRLQSGRAGGRAGGASSQLELGWSTRAWGSLQGALWHRSGLHEPAGMVAREATAHSPRFRPGRPLQAEPVKPTMTGLWATEPPKASASSSSSVTARERMAASFRELGWQSG